MKNIKLFEEFEMSDDDFKGMKKDLTKLGFSPILEAIENGEAQFYFEFVVEKVFDMWSNSQSEEGDGEDGEIQVIESVEFPIEWKDTLEDLFSEIESDLNGNVGGSDWMDGEPEFEINSGSDPGYKYTPKDFWEKFDDPKEEISKLYKDLESELFPHLDASDYITEYPLEHEYWSKSIPYAAYQISNYSPLYIVIEGFNPSDLEDPSKSIKIGEGYNW